ncbi:tail tube [Vibrio phage EniLVp02]
MPAPNLNMSEFMSRIASRDLARPNLFRVVIPSLSNSIQNDNTSAPAQGDGGFLDQLLDRGRDIGTDLLMSQSSLFRKITGAYSPAIVRGVFGKDYLSFLGENFDPSRDIGLMVKAVNIPGMALDISTNWWRRTPHHVVTQRNNNTVTMQVYLTPEQVERLFFIEWVNIIFDSKTAQVEFFSKYAKTIEIFAYNRDGVASNKTTLIEAFPIRVGDVQMDYESNNGLCLVEVEFQYSYSVQSIVDPEDRNTGNPISRGRTILTDAESILRQF